MVNPYTSEMLEREGTKQSISKNFSTLVLWFYMWTEDIEYLINWGKLECIEHIKKQTFIYWERERKRERERERERREILILRVLILWKIIWNVVINPEASWSQRFNSLWWPPFGIFYRNITLNLILLSFFLMEGLQAHSRSMFTDAEDTTAPVCSWRNQYSIYQKSMVLTGPARAS